MAKNRTQDPKPRLLVLNNAAQRIVDSQRDLHPRCVFTYEDRDGNRDRLHTVRNSGWLGRHIYGRRLRAAGVRFEDRQDLLGHQAGRITTEYSAPEIGNLIQAANQVISPENLPDALCYDSCQDDVTC